MEISQDLSDTSEARLLIVEDDPEVGAGLKEFFVLKEYDVTHVADGEQALREITTLPPYDLVLLDVMLPKKNGFEVLREARRAGVDSPVIMLTVKGSKEDKLRGFELGADDYVTKPFNAEELAARVHAVLKRSQPPADAPMDTYEFGDVSVNFSSHIARRSGEPVEFTALEFDILKYFIEHRGRTVSRKQLLRDVWGISGEITTRTIDRHVASLRKKVEPNPTKPTYIETVYGIGYRFTA
jgi:DNA-binding response OmpR family regulator